MVLIMCLIKTEEFGLKVAYLTYAWSVSGYNFVNTNCPHWLHGYTQICVKPGCLWPKFGQKTLKMAKIDGNGDVIIDTRLRVVLRMGLFFGQI